MTKLGTQDQRPQFDPLRRLRQRAQESPVLPHSYAGLAGLAIQQVILEPDRVKAFRFGPQRHITYLTLAPHMCLTHQQDQSDFHIPPS